MEMNHIKGLIEEQKDVCVFLTNGTKLQGTIIKQCKDCILLVFAKMGNTQIVYKHAIATIVDNEAHGNV